MPEEVDRSAFKWIRARPCPICGREIKHFETHTRPQFHPDEGHQRLRRLQAEIFRELLADHGYRRDSRGLTELRQLAWDRAIAIIEAEMREGHIPRHRTP